MPTEVITAVSLLIAVTAVLLTLWQAVLQRRASQAQVFLHMLDQFNGDDVYDGCVSLYALPTYDTYELYERTESAETQRRIRKLVEFLNDTARLVKSGYLPRQKVWDIYFMVYRTAYRKLLPWWLQGERQGTYAQRYIAFENMCLEVASVSEKHMADYDRKAYHKVLSDATRVGRQ